MPDHDRKGRTISVRLSQAEYEVLKTHYRAYGVRNISEIARLALQRIADGSADPQDGVAARLSDLDERIHRVESQLSLLLAAQGQVVGRSPAPRPAQDDRQ